MRHLPEVLFAGLMLAWVALVVISTVDMDATVSLFRLLTSLLSGVTE